MTEARWQLITTYASLPEAELAAGRLESVGIPSQVDQGGNVGIFGPGHAQPFGGVGLLVPSEEVDEARAALDLG